MKDKLLKDKIITRHEWPENMAPDDLLDFDEEKEYETKPVLIKSFSNVKLDFCSVAYTGNRLIEDTVPDIIQRKYYQRNYLLKSFLVSRKIKLKPGPNYLLLTDNWSSGHFHFISDVLPKYLCLGQDSDSFDFLLPDLPYYREIGLPLLERVRGKDGIKVIWMQRGNFYHVPELSIINTIAPSGRYDSNIMKSLNKVLNIPSTDSVRRLYISRKKAFYRKITNEDRLIEILKDFDFSVCYAEDYSLTEQAELFSSCSLLLGIHGAGLANCVFMKPGSKLIELRKKENGPLNVGYWHLADSLAMRYFYYNGLPNSSSTIVGRGCNLEIPLKDFQDKIMSIV